MSTTQTPREALQGVLEAAAPLVLGPDDAATFARLLGIVFTGAQKVIDEALLTRSTAQTFDVFDDRTEPR